MNADARFQRPGSLRLSGYDYRSRGAYYVTVCCHERRHLLSRIVDCVEPVLTPFGAIARDTLLELPDRYRGVQLDEWIVMPDHIHAILWLRSGVGDESLQNFASLSEVVRGFKTDSAKRINKARGIRGSPVYQRGFFDRVIRDERELGEVRVYIRRNPQRWVERRGGSLLP